ncbi:hypothetical protein HDV01_000633 [Terramyces sp. JEL0728]|nr:hypothetical protein HDV01_000633 [Terramyces sp. JEL0728]
MAVAKVRALQSENFGNQVMYDKEMADLKKVVKKKMQGVLKSVSSVASDSKLSSSEFSTKASDSGYSTASPDRRGPKIAKRVSFAQ